ncbi:MAG: GNAT family N-acetyltransferase [Deltaproteobacteria bacterium]|nr:GNAT family N-acetyltransferase [Deltaproteobacteria bacterium]MBW1923141.1 GNAT family N-acetyltransferase [Deltaproteobacteria bacterium]MBW1949262.1 GNAT family N-acetyltransferase [Deltaproteobacteria bacterium]MBW2008042.1 GNAT family N-acetyltransferase [Deltaproteobacteria bacterium]MBW2103109.1 GNAT family N-acetyltransferase [Deltaproteobacteria bacterium]
MEIEHRTPLATGAGICGTAEESPTSSKHQQPRPGAASTAGDRVLTATEADYEAVRTTNSLLRLPDVPGFYWDTESYIREAIREERCMVVKNQTVLKGAMVLERRGPEAGYARESLAVGSLAVRPEYRKTGVGMMLVRYAVQRARQEGLRLYAESFFPYRKVDFYLGLGFRRGPQRYFHGVPYHVFFLDP